MPKLAKKYHVYAVDCYGHGGSLHDASKYNVVDIGNAVIDFIQNEIEKPVSLLGHSSGGLIAAYVASHSNLCRNLILEDPPFFHPRESDGKVHLISWTYQPSATSF